MSEKKKVGELQDFPPQKAVPVEEGEETFRYAHTAGPWPVALDGRYRDAASRYSEIQSVSRLFLDTENTEAYENAPWKFRYRKIQPVSSPVLDTENTYLPSRRLGSVA